MKGIYLKEFIRKYNKLKFKKHYVMWEIHTVDIFQPKKEGNSDMCYNMYAT